MQPGAGGQQSRDGVQLRDGPHALGGEHAAALQLPVLVMIQILRQWSLGKWRKASTSSLASCMSAAAFRNRSANEAARSSLRDSISSANTERRAGRDHDLVSLGDALQQVAGEMDAGALTSAPFGATLPDIALKLPADRLGEPSVGIAQHQLDARDAALFEVEDERRPEGLGLTVAHLEAQ